MKQLSYIMQEDHLQPYLTVLESMEMASKLRNCTLKLDVCHQILVSIIIFNAIGIGVSMGRAYCVSVYHAQAPVKFDGICIVNFGFY